MNTQKIDKIFYELVRKRYIKECIIMVENSRGDVQYSQCSNELTLDSPILLASISKLFTTTCIIKLIEEGRLNLNEKLVNYFDSEILENLHVINGVDYSLELEIYDLLFQTSGLPDIFEKTNNSLKKKALEHDIEFTVDDWVNETKKNKARFKPRSKNKAFYADINFILLGEVIEKITQLSLSQAYDKYIFQHLNLKNTYLATSTKDYVPEFYFKGELLSRPKFIISNYACGGCVSTPRELMIFIKEFFKGGLFDINIFDKLSTFRKLQSSMGPIKYGGGYMEIQLSGFNTMFQGTGELLGHSGTTGSFAFYYPDKDIFIVGNLNQLSSPSLAIITPMKIAMI